MKTIKNSQYIMNDKLGLKKLNYYEYAEKMSIKNKIINEQKGTCQAPIKRFQKSQHNNNAVVSSNKDSKIIVNKNVDKFLYSGAEKKRSYINTQGYKIENQTNNPLKKYVGNNILKNENIKLNNKNHPYYSIDMTTNNNNINNIQHNRDGNKTKLYNDKQYINLNNNATSSFPQTLRIYENNSTTKKANNETKYPNPQNGKMTKNKFIESKVPKNRSIYGSQDNYRVAKINYDGNISSNIQKKNIKNNNRNSDIIKKNLQNYECFNNKPSDLNKINQKNFENVYMKKHQNITKEKKPIKKFINIKADKNDNLFFPKENIVKLFTNLADRKNENFEFKGKEKKLIFQKRPNEYFELKGKEKMIILEKKLNEYFQLKCKQKKIILEKKLNEYFELKGKEKNYKNLSCENSESFIVEGKDESYINKLDTNEKIKEISTLLKQFNLPEEKIKAFLKEFFPTFESNKPKKNKFSENEIKNANDNLPIEINNTYLNDKLTKKEKREDESNTFSSRRKNKKEQKEKEKDSFTKSNKIYGFRNEGNNCYLNSSLQLLTRIKDLKEEVINFNENYVDNDTQGKLIIEFRNMLNTIENSSKEDFVLNPSKLKRIMGNVDEKYNSYGQEDSNEFITNFINALLSETGNKEKKIKKLNIKNDLEKRPYENLCKKFYQRKGYSFILNLFYGITKQTKFCKKCGKINLIKFNVYNMLDFPLYNLVKSNSNKELTLEELYNNFKEESYCEVTCNNCDSNKMYSKTSIYTLPKYLMINLGRTCDNEYFYNNVTYPKNLEIKSEYENDTKNYLLDCVIEHSGGFSYGHYTSLVPIDTENNKWIRISDSHCDRTSVGFQSQNASILLYKII